MFSYQCKNTAIDMQIFGQTLSFLLSTFYVYESGYNLVQADLETFGFPLKFDDVLELQLPLMPKSKN